MIINYAEAEENSPERREETRNYRCTKYRVGERVEKNAALQHATTSRQKTSGVGLTSCRHTCSNDDDFMTASAAHSSANRTSATHLYRWAAWTAQE